MKTGIEFIFVDDASSDGSIDVLNATIAKYPDRVSQCRIITHALNRGVAAARNTALDSAIGEYIIYCDSDDWVERDMYEQMYKLAKAKNADIVGCDYYEEYGTRKVYHSHDITVSGKKLITGILRFDGVLTSYLWCRMIRRDFYKSSPEFCAPSGILFLEDTVAVCCMHAATNKVAYLPVAMYHYNCVNMESIVHTLSLDKIKSGLKALSLLQKKFSDDSEILEALLWPCYLMKIRSITHTNSYCPSLWREMKTDVDYRFVKTIRARIAVMLVDAKMFRLNYAVQRMIEKIIH